MGHGQFEEAERYLHEGKIDQAIEAFEALRIDYPGTWFDRTSRERLAKLRKTEEEP